MTDNHGYETPEKGATEWHESLNRNFRYIDRDVEIRDLDAAKDNYRPKSGAKFLATDTENVYVGDGSQWLRLSTSGQNPLFDTVSTKTIVDRNSGNGYSVDELAGGSGSGGVEPPIDAIVTLEGGTPTAYRSDGTQLVQDNNATLAVQTAIDHAVGSDGRGVVKIGPGSYSLRDRIEVRENLLIEGSGMGVTVFHATGENQEWTTANSGLEDITVRGFTQDGNGQGERTGVNLNQGININIEFVEVLNAGDRDGGGGTTPALRVTRGTDCSIRNCRVERSSSVSIEAAIYAKSCEIVNCVVRDGIYNSGAGFVHGISIEKSENCRIQGCHVEDPTDGGATFTPALNVNNADDFVCAGNTVKNSGGLNNANGPCKNGVIANNTFDNSGGVSIKSGNGGSPSGMLIANNVFDGGGGGGGVKIGGGAEADIRNNLFRNFDGGPVLWAVDTEQAVSVVGNSFRDNSGELVSIGNPRDDGVVLIANNFFEKEYLGGTNDAAVVSSAKYGVMTGNVFQSALGGDDQFNAKPTVHLKDDATTWAVIGNYFQGANSQAAGPELSMTGGLVSGNFFEGEKKVTFNWKDALGSPIPARPVVRDNITLRDSSSSLGTNALLDHPDGAYEMGKARTGTYIGDGTTDRLITTYTNPEHVIIEGSDGVLYDQHAAFGAGFEYNAPTGRLLLTEGGFLIGDNGSDAHPNRLDETYTFYVK